MAPAQSVATLHPGNLAANHDVNDPRSKSTSNLAAGSVPLMPIPAHMFPPGHPAALRPESEGEESIQQPMQPQHTMQQQQPDVVVSVGEMLPQQHEYPAMSVAPYYEERPQQPPPHVPASMVNNDSPAGSQLQLQDPPLRNPYATYHAQPVQAGVPEQPAGRMAPYGAPSSPYSRFVALIVRSTFA